jgi:hypothetical protein
MYSRVTLYQKRKKRAKILTKSDLGCKFAHLCMTCCQQLSTEDSSALRVCWLRRARARVDRSSHPPGVSLPDKADLHAHHRALSTVPASIRNGEIECIRHGLYRVLLLDRLLLLRRRHHVRRWTIRVTLWCIRDRHAVHILMHCGVI